MGREREGDKEGTEGDKSESRGVEGVRDDQPV